MHKHKRSEPVRAYLLGTIDEAEATKLEVSYFTDPSVLDWIQAIESTLIEDYLANRLSPEDRRLFESRYLEVPALKQRLAEVRNQREIALSRPERASWIVWRWVAASAMVCMVAFVMWSNWPWGRKHPPVVTRAQIEAPVAVLTLRLSPGLAKGSTSKGEEVTVPGRDSRVSLNLELPGRRTVDYYRVRVLRVGINGDSTSAWMSPAVRSELSENGTNVRVEPDSAILTVGDYLVETTTVSGEVQETYQFRVIANGN
jgi:hypothetical protein